jgi:hypothetical protein
MRFIVVCLITIICVSVSFAAPCPTSEYRQRLTRIGFKDTASVAEAAKELLKTAQGQPDKCKEELLFLFRKYYFASLDKYYAQCKEKLSSLFRNNYSYLEKNNEEINLVNLINEANKDPLTKSLAQAGWTVKVSEGDYYLGELPNWFATEFKEILTPAYWEYFRLRSQEIKEGFSEDAGLLISWEQLRKRIITWENFLNQYPDFVERLNIQPYLAAYLSTYLGGIDNSTIYDLNNLALKQEVKTSYENFIKQDKDSKYHHIVQEYYAMLKKHGFIVPKNYAAFLQKHDFKTLLGVQPPTY